MLVFGWRTALLAGAEAQLLLIAAGLAGSSRNRAANRFLAALLLVTAGLLTPYALGYAGAYDAWKGLTFAPFAVALAVGPLAFGYVQAFTRGRPPDRMALHLLPAAAQALYSSAAFLLPTPAKMAWYLGGHRHWVEPMLGLLTVASLAAYAVASLLALRRFRAGLPDQVSDTRRYAAAWLGRVLVWLVALLAIWASLAAWRFAFGWVGYLDQFWVYAATAGLALYLAVEGWRQSELRVPQPAHERPVAAAPVRDWRALGERWRARIATEGWWAEPELTLADVARRLGVNTHHLSRGVNDGLGVNFAALINGLRAEAVAEALRTRRVDDLLGLALESGFSSKTSFNRVFAATYGQSPSAYRRAHGPEPEFSASEGKPGRGSG